MTDQYHSNEIHRATDALNKAISAALRAGLFVEIETSSLSYLNGLVFTHIDATVYRRINPIFEKSK